MRSRKVIIILCVIGMSIFAYSQYILVSRIDVSITRNQLIEQNEEESKHDIELEFSNPSILILTAGNTDFFIISTEEIIGKGKLKPFILPPLNKSSASGTYLKDSSIVLPDNAEVKISGVTKYDVFFTTIDVPFVFNLTPEQAREFIHQN